MSIATKVSKSALLFHHRSTNKSAVAVKFSAPAVDLILKFFISSNRFNKIQLLLTEISHYYSSALLKQLTDRFNKNDLSTSTDRYLVSTNSAHRFPCGKAHRSVVLPLPQKAYRAFRGPLKISLLRPPDALRRRCQRTLHFTPPRDPLPKSHQPRFVQGPDIFPCREPQP